MTRTPTQTATPTATVALIADLYVNKLDNPDPVRPNTLFTYTIEVVNYGPQGAVNAQMTDMIPANTTFQALNAPAGWVCLTPPVNGTGLITCTIPFIPPGGTYLFEVTVLVDMGVPAGTVIQNTTDIISTTEDPNPNNNTYTSTTTVLLVTVTPSPTLSPTPTRPPGPSPTPLPAGAVPSLRLYCELDRAGDPLAGAPGLSKDQGRKTPQGVRLADVFGSSLLKTPSNFVVAKLLQGIAAIEDLPYTDPEAPFDPQHAQAPRDSLTWNPAILSELYALDELNRYGLYNHIKANNGDAAEKVYTRLWYECDHLDKDQDASGGLTDADIHYPAIMQEWTYRFINAGPASALPLPIQARPGVSQFVFPVGMRGLDLFGADGDIQTNDGGVNNVGYGLTSLDANFDTFPDIVEIHSELTIQARTGLGLDLNNNGSMDGLDTDGVPLNGDELVVMAVAPAAIPQGGAAQFLDHVVIPESFTTNPNGVRLRVYWTGSIAPKDLGVVVLSVGQAVVANNNAPMQTLPVGGNNLGNGRGAWFAYVDAVDAADGTVRLILGRGLGATHAAMESAPGVPNTGPNPWFTKRLYVDGHEYNTVAVYTQSQGAGATFGFITLRSATPKFNNVVNNQFSVIQDAYQPGESLGMAPPFNYEHSIVTDVLDNTGFTDTLAQTRFWGNVRTPIAPILQANQPLPYQAYRGPLYSDVAASRLAFVAESRNPQFLGELTERYAQFQPAPGQPETEFWYRQQFHTRPDQYTEFILPNNPPAATAPDPELYLVTTNWFAPQGEYRRWVQGNPTPIDQIGGHAKFWFDPDPNATLNGLKIYKDSSGLRIYGRGYETAGDDNVRVAPPMTPVDTQLPFVEVLPYTEVTSIFDPQSPQAPVKDVLTLNPAYLNEFRRGSEPLGEAYGQISVVQGPGGTDAGEKVFPRFWYEPEYVDVAFTGVVQPDGTIAPGEALQFPAVVQEYTYMFLDPFDQPTWTRPGGKLLFPMATGPTELPFPPAGATSGWSPPFNSAANFGYGLTSFDANGDGAVDPVRVETEASLFALTGIQADFNGNTVMDGFDPDGFQLSGDELAVFMHDGVILSRSNPTYQSAQFLDHLVQLVNVDYISGRVDLRIWYTGGGLHVSGPCTNSYFPDYIRDLSLNLGEMVIVNRNAVKRIPAGGNNLGLTDGAWFAYVTAVGAPIPGDPSRETVSLMIGRAVGGARAPMYNGVGSQNLASPTPWYLKRFYVDGHEYNVSALLTVPIGGSEIGFKAITIRTPVPKECDPINHPQSQALQAYFEGPRFGIDTNALYVMPPFNVAHTIREDIRRIEPNEFGMTPVNADLARCLGPWRGVGPLDVRINAEALEPRFSGELRELPFQRPATANAVWSVEQFHTFPDLFTDLRLPRDQYYLLTSDWEAEGSRFSYRGCQATIDTQAELATIHPIPAPNDTDPLIDYYQASANGRVRFQFWYWPQDPQDIYVNIYQGSVVTGQVNLQGRANDSGARVTSGSYATISGADGAFALVGPSGPSQVQAGLMGYLPSQTQVNAGQGATTIADPALLLGGDTNGDLKVGLFDLVIVAANYDSQPPTDIRADINGNGRVDLADLTMVGINYGMEGVQGWTSGATKHAEAQAKRRAGDKLAIRLETPDMVKAGEEFDVVVRVVGAQNLMAADVALTYDVTRLALVSDGKTAVTAGDLFDSQALYEAVNRADETEGRVHYVATQTADAKPTPDRGVLFTVRFRAQVDGHPRVFLASAVFADLTAEVLTP